VDLPAPFSYMPKMVTTAGGNVTIQTMLNALATQFTKSFVRDYEAWAASEDTRSQREANYWAATEGAAAVETTMQKEAAQALAAEVESPVKFITDPIGIPVEM
jgi:regulator of PEP synthase PpsR (kinase-PPPase family)